MEGESRVNWRPQLGILENDAYINCLNTTSWEALRYVITIVYVILLKIHID